MGQGWVGGRVRGGGGRGTQTHDTLRKRRISDRFATSATEAVDRGTPIRNLCQRRTPKIPPVGVHHKQTSGWGASQRPPVGVHHKQTSGRGASQRPLVGVHHKQISGRGAPQTSGRGLPQYDTVKGTYPLTAVISCQG